MNISKAFHEFLRRQQERSVMFVQNDCLKICALNANALVAPPFKTFYLSSLTMAYYNEVPEVKGRFCVSGNVHENMPFG